MRAKGWCSSGGTLHYLNLMWPTNNLVIFIFVRCSTNQPKIPKALVIILTTRTNGHHRWWWTTAWEGVYRLTIAQIFISQFYCSTYHSFDQFPVTWLGKKGKCLHVVVGDLWRCAIKHSVSKTAFLGIRHQNSSVQDDLYTRTTLQICIYMITIFPAKSE